MAKVIRTERHRRGFFGWIFKGLFIAFNFLMFVTLIVVWTGVNRTSTDVSAVAGGIGTFIIMVIWALGDVILGILTYFSRGKKVIIEEVLE